MKVTPHFGQRISVILIRRTSTGGILYPHCGQGVASDAITFSRLIFFRAGIRGLYRGAVRNRVNDTCQVAALITPNLGPNHVARC